VGSTTHIFGSLVVAFPCVPLRGGRASPLLSTAKPLAPGQAAATLAARVRPPTRLQANATKDAAFAVTKQEAERMLRERDTQIQALQVGGGFAFSPLFSPSFFHIHARCACAMAPTPTLCVPQLPGAEQPCAPAVCLLHQ